jgi:hypothetical protein
VDPLETVVEPGQACQEVFAAGGSGLGGFEPVADLGIVRNEIPRQSLGATAALGKCGNESELNRTAHFLHVIWTDALGAGAPRHDAGWIWCNR